MRYLAILITVCYLSYGNSPDTGEQDTGVSDSIEDADITIVEPEVEESSVDLEMPRWPTNPFDDYNLDFSPPQLTPIR